MNALLVSWIAFFFACEHPKIIVSEIPGGESADSESDSTDSESGIADSESGAADSDSGTGAGDTESEQGCGIPENLSWTSSAALIYPPEGQLAVKEPSVLFFENSWHIYFTTKSTDEWNMAYLNVTDWNSAGDVPPTMVNQNPDLTGYKTSPQIFYFEPDKNWYLIYQSPNPAFSTSDDPGDVDSWSAAADFMTTYPDGSIDFWTICDDTDCYIFFTALDGVLYRARTEKTAFPDGFEGSIETAMDVGTENRFDMFQGVNVYKMAGTDKYLLIASAIGANRYLASWTADRLDGEWTPLSVGEENAFASTYNVSDAEWAQDGINAGELLRTNNPDETMTVDTCNLRFLYHGLLRAGSSDSLNEYAVGILTDAR